MRIPQSDHYVISVSYGNDSMAMIQWAKELNLDLYGKVSVVYCDTGWAKDTWASRVLLGEDFARRCGFEPVRLTSMGMPELVRTKKGWPGNGQQFCTIHLKGVPFLNWLDEIDPGRTAVTLVGKRREESPERADTPEFVEESVYHGDRMLWHPLYMHGELLRNSLLQRAGIPILPHRSEECDPCVNANRGDMLRLSPAAMARVNELEVEIGKPMFRPKRFHGIGIYGVVMWARHGKNHSADPSDPAKYSLKDTIDEPPSGCSLAFGCKES